MKSILISILINLLILSTSIAQVTSPLNSTQLPEKNIKGDEKYENKAKLKKMVSDRAWPDGNKNNFGRYLEEMQLYRNNSPEKLTANWNYVDASGNLYGDVGRTNSITIDTLNPGRIYVCTPHSGVWVTNDNGVTYMPITEALPTQNTSCLVIDPSNTNTLYLATGTYQMDMQPNSMGIFKSADGGANWNATGLTFSPASGFIIGELAINPQNNSSVLAATTDGLYRTYDSGISWTKILNDSTSSVSFKPGDTTVIYTMGSKYYRSGNAGISFSQITTGINVNFQWKWEYYLKTSAATPDVLYIFTAGGFINPTFNTKMYVHKSTDSGQSFSILDSLMNEVCYQVAVSQTAPDKIIAGYWNVWLKENASSPFVRLTQTNQSGPYQYMHADQRGISFDPFDDNTIYFCNDGGLYRTTNNGSTFQNITANMQLSHFYDFAHAQTTDYKILVAPLDVSPFIIGNSGIDVTFSQFVEAFSTSMSPVNENNFYLSHQNPLFTANSGASFYSSTHPLIGNASYLSNALHYDFCKENVVYFCTYNDILKSTDGGATFQYFLRTTYNPVNSFFGTPQGFVVSRANPRYVYVYYKDSVFLTTTGSNPLTNITGNLPVSSAVISHLVVDPANEKNVWVSFTGYASGNKVFFSSDAGQTWVNISSGIPNIPVSALVCQEGDIGAVYAATDGGVFYIDNSFPTWQNYNTGLPNVIVNGIDIQRTTGKLRIATFGRGVWESDLYSPSPANYILPPVAIFNVPPVNACVSEIILPQNNSCGIVDSVLWLFPGGTPSTSTDYTPSVSYNAPGTYTITLIAYNTGGSDTLTLVDILTVETPEPLPYYEPVADLNQLTLPAGMSVTDVDGDGNTWFREFFTDGSSGAGDDFMVFNNFSYNLNGLEEKLIFPQIDLTGTVNPKLFFYRSYCRRDLSITDSLKIYAKMCGGTTNIIYAKGGAQLANIPGTLPNNFWVPNQPSHWVRDSVDLTAFAGNPAVTISFINRGYFGQLLYIDDFRVYETFTTDINEISDAVVHIFPNPAQNTIHIRSNKRMSNIITLRDLMGRIVLQHQPNGDYVSTIDISSLAKGAYFLFINDGGNSTPIKLVKS